MKKNEMTKEVLAALDDLAAVVVERQKAMSRDMEKLNADLAAALNDDARRHINGDIGILGKKMHSLNGAFAKVYKTCFDAAKDATR